MYYAELQRRHLPEVNKTVISICYRRGARQPDEHRLLALSLYLEPVAMVIAGVAGSWSRAG
ncbi:MAG: hypothetical protein PV344_01905, partial [Anaplasma sp.]|nr:hypothetical protein [Anaplasma sp.]